MYFTVGSVEQQHGSLIRHLLSQVRIGMDLTKITLPTFILERRSLLEMFADFLAHPDLWCAIADGETPEDRMVACLRWYLSAFHAGRNASIAKKPYNPILGEIFQCHYDMEKFFPNEGEKVAKDGPVSWAKERDVSIIAEQVSHHPPISAFYAENVSKRLSLNAHIWTKSKFLGLSIGVSMVGKAVLSVLDHDEQYIITFPSCYGRAILTTPWMELGGKTQITCNNGFTANIDFHTKPFYGGKKHTISADVMPPGGQPKSKPLLSVQGEWNGLMQATWTATNKTECFLDTQKMEAHPKSIRSIAEQESYESRRLWKYVTYYLAKKDVSHATEHKSKLEQKQREEAKSRKETGTEWKQRVFESVGEDFFYKTPLKDRYEITHSGK